MLLTNNNSYIKTIAFFIYFISKIAIKFVIKNDKFSI